ncbi:MAG: ribonuclease P protein component 1 [Methanobacteriaceae archaeon]
MISPQNIFRHELIGLSVEITASSNSDLIGIKGKVVDETKNTLKIEKINGDEVLIPKNVATFNFTLKGGDIVEIEGKILVARPEDRIKKKFRKYW